MNGDKILLHKTTAVDLDDDPQTPEDFDPEPEEYIDES